MHDTTHDTEFATTVKTALAAPAAFADDADDTADLDRDTFKAALDAAMSAHYNAQIAPIQNALADARENGDAIAARSQEAALDAARDELQGMFAAGYSRLNKALDAVENGTITFQQTTFDPERDNDGDVDYAAHGLAEGDDVVVMVSHKDDQPNSRYVLLPTNENGFRVGTCPDKTTNDSFPVCKHEMAWLIYRVINPLLATPVVVEHGVETETADTDTTAKHSTLA